MPGTRKGLRQLRGQVGQEQVRIRPGWGLWGSLEGSEEGPQGPRFGWAWTQRHPAWCPSCPRGPAGLVREGWPSPWMPGRLKGALAVWPKGHGTARRKFRYLRSMMLAEVSVFSRCSGTVRIGLEIGKGAQARPCGGQTRRGPV